jgi:hypothetical protein
METESHPISFKCLDYEIPYEVADEKLVKAGYKVRLVLIQNVKELIQILNYYPMTDLALLEPRIFHIRTPSILVLCKMVKTVKLDTCYGAKPPAVEPDDSWAVSSIIPFDIFKVYGFSKGNIYIDPYLTPRDNFIALASAWLKTCGQQQEAKINK